MIRRAGSKLHQWAERIWHSPTAHVLAFLTSLTLLIAIGVFR